MTTTQSRTDTAPSSTGAKPPSTVGSSDQDATPLAHSFLGDYAGTAPNLVTLTRTVLAVALASVAIVETAPQLLLLAYIAYWVGDILDGWLARRLERETRLGAVLDIVSDRACTAMVCSGLLVLYPHLTVVVVPFLLSFMVLDTVLSMAFLCWPLKSPNYFGQVDSLVYRLNWSPPAKALNTAGVVLLGALGWMWAALVLVLVLVAVKVWSTVRVQRLLTDVARGTPG